MYRAVCLAVLGIGVLSLCGAESADEPNSFFVGSWEFDRGNVAVHDVGMAYADRERVIINDGVYPNSAEYDIEFPVDARYRVDGRYAAADSRPVDLIVDDVVLARGFAGTTGSWESSTAIWERLCEVDLTAGKHTVKLVCPGPCIPHIVALRFASDQPFPEGFKRKPKRFKPDMTALFDGRPNPGEYGYAAYVREDGFVDAPAVYDPHVPYRWVPPPTPKGERILEYLLMGDGRYNVAAEVAPDEYDDVFTAMLSVDIGEGRVEREPLAITSERIERMLTHAARLIGRFREMRPGILASDRAEVEALLAEARRYDFSPTTNPSGGAGAYGLYARAYRLKNRVALSNPLLDFAELLFAKRQTYDTSHIYTTYFDGSHRYGGELSVLSQVRPEGRTHSITTELSPDAIYRDPDLSFDGTRVLFSYKPDLPTACRIYEVGIDGTGLRQLTNSEYDDVDPCYLPDGRIVFISTRCRRVVLCHNAFTVSVLHTMDASGGDVECVSQNTVNDFTPSVLADGRVAYTRWEYVDKNLGNNQSLWVVNPDGGRPTHVAGEHWGPVTFWEPRAIPDSSKLICTLSPHMPIAVGPIALVDPADVCASPAVYENITPELPPPHHFGWDRSDVGYYCNPFPLSEDFYIVSYAYGPDPEQPNGYGLYLLDRWNNRDLVYRDPATSCFEAFPVKPRPVPPALAPTQMVETDDMATVCVLDVYQGLGGVERGAVKYLRVLEEVPKPVSAECSAIWLQYPIISNGMHLAVKRLLGTVPVEPDGSVQFRAPANKPLYFAALDADRMEVQRMRALTEFRPGERVTCIGCHEPRDTAPANGTRLAFQREPSEIEPPAGGVRAPDFAYDVQPILDRRCSQCHTGGQPAGGLDLSPEPTNLFNVAYESLAQPRYVSFVFANDSSTLPLRPPGYYGSHASKLIEALRTTHADRVRLSPDEFERLVTWIDCNAPYYGTYTYSRKGTIGGRELLTPTIRAGLDDVFARRCASCHASDPERAHRVRFGDVEASPVLLAPLAKAEGGTQACGAPVFETRDDPDAQKLIATLRALAEEIRTNPREDMFAQRPPIADESPRYVYRP